MTLSQYQRKNFGFSLPEVLAIVVIVGILAALSAPSFFSWVNNKRIEDVSRQVEGALKEGQATAIRTSQQCSLTISSSSITATPPSCLPTGARDLTQLGGGTNPNAVDLIAANNTPIEFSLKGSTASSNVLVFYHPDQSQGMRCIAIAAGIGIIRTGEFRGAYPPTANQPEAKDCYAS
ncbi:type IV pilin protein [Acaryochloris sp. IP29b_bin.148]|uniref:pilus assembly FimT family protein n=1 Tax=Acaryochloris sp. IP29b_bin.148 TaxID=2969218 RepID=UPI00262CA8E9|nr:type IV pilin protein [Acaryochloris sp. IP29b_bin.148]